MANSAATAARRQGVSLSLDEIPSCLQRIRTFKGFYEALGFVLDSEVAIFNASSGGFILQRYFQEDWANNFMMQLMVDDLDMWWAHIESLDLTKRFGVPAPKPPAVQPWDFVLPM